jgi:hypothetical protein
VAAFPNQNGFANTVAEHMHQQNIALNVTLHHARERGAWERLWCDIRIRLQTALQSSKAKAQANEAILATAIANNRIQHEANTARLTAELTVRRLEEISFVYVTYSVRLGGLQNVVRHEAESLYEEDTQTLKSVLCWQLVVIGVVIIISIGFGNTFFGCTCM